MPCSQRSEPAAESITPIACQTAGTAWQNVCARASASTAYAGRAENTTPEVPSTTERGPGSTTPTPSAAAAWSPAPPISVDSCAGGSHSDGSSSAAQTSWLQRRFATSKSSVPEASAASIARSPRSRSRT